MFKITFSFARYAIASIASVGFGLQMKERLITLRTSDGPAT